MIENKFPDMINPYRIDFRNYTWFSDTMVETGTHCGTGVDQALESGFSDIRSVELYDMWYLHSLNRFKSDSRIKLWHGDSREHLNNMLPDKPCVVVLDAHPSGPGTAGHDDLTMNGDNSIYGQDNVLKAELDIILNNKHKHLILIDDQSSINEEYTNMMKGYSFRYVGNKYLVCIPD